MRAIVWDGKINIRDDVEGSTPGLRDVKVRIHRAGLCHSDVSVMNGTIPYPTPVVLGHEGAGIVEEVGAAVTGVKPGDHVVTTTLGNCGQCAACDRGVPTQCRNPFGGMLPRFSLDGKPVLAFANSGVFAEYVVVHEQQCVVIDKRVPLEAACLIGCAVVTGAGAVLNRAKVQPGQTVLVIGAGGIGQSVIQAARISAASRIVVVDANPGKEAVARKFGATDFIDASSVGDTVTAARDLGFPNGFDHSFECVGHPALIRQAIDLLDWGGQCTLLGVPRPGSEAAFVVQSMYQNKTIAGCRYGTTRPHYDIPLLAGFYLDGKFDLDEMVSKQYPLSDFEVALHDLEEGKLNRGVLQLA
jgi:S-(hydroxymethyl)glutathione dehydrogenase/alcohol dehydrogenase